MHNMFVCHKDSLSRRLAETQGVAVVHSSWCDILGVMTAPHIYHGCYDNWQQMELAICCQGDMAHSDRLSRLQMIAVVKSAGFPPKAFF